jgi:hypothetical protein
MKWGPSSYYLFGFFPISSYFSSVGLNIVMHLSDYFPCDGIKSYSKFSFKNVIFTDLLTVFPHQKKNEHI